MGLPNEDWEREQKAALFLLERGLVTMSEVARLRGVSRQNMFLLVRSLVDPLETRRQYLEELWQKTLRKFS